MKKFIIAFIGLCAATCGNAQTYLDHLQHKEQGQATVTVTESKEIDALVNGKPTAQPTPPAKKTTPKPERTTPKETKNTEPKHQAAVTNDEAEPTTVHTSHKVMRQGYKVNGYRIQVYYGGNTREDKNKAQQIGNSIKMRFPSQPVYTHYYNPHWTCRVGNFRTYEEANDMLQAIKKAGFTQATIMKGKITVQY